MDTFINEICGLPEKNEDDIIPANAICGNGDVGIILDYDCNDLIIHISKCDFWKFKSGSNSDGGIKTVGKIRIGNVSLDNYKVVQNMKKGILSVNFGTNSLELFVSPDNIIFANLECDIASNAPTVTVEMSSDCKSKVFTAAVGGLKWYMRKFDGKDLLCESDVAVCSRRYPAQMTENRKSIEFCFSVVSNFDTKNYAAQAIKLAAEADYEKSKKKTAKFWNDFFCKSDISIPDKRLEKQYHGSLYLLGCCMGNRDFPPGLYGNFIVNDNMPWHGSYHLYSKYEAPFYCVCSSNHTELAHCYIKPLNDITEDGKKYAEKYLGYKGVCFPSGIGPLGLDFSETSDSLEMENYFLSQKNNALYGAVIPIMLWYSSYDRDYAFKYLYNYIKENADFWETYLVYENGRYVIKKDTIHEVPFCKGNDLKGNRYSKQINAQNNILSLGLVRMLFKCIIDMSSELRLNRDKIPEWQKILDNLSEYPTFIKQGKRCFRYTEKGISWVKNNTFCIQHIFPCSQIGLSSDRKLLKTARNTYFVNDRHLDDNGSFSYLPSGARLGVKPEFLLNGLNDNIDKFGLPNMLFKHNGGCLEHLATIPTTVNEMLMQSYDGVIRLFPCWNTDDSASFQSLRADGAFLVTASLKKGKVSLLRIKSLRGRKCRVMIPPEVKISVKTLGGKNIKFTKNEGVIEFATSEDTEYVLI